MSRSTLIVLAALILGGGYWYLNKPSNDIEEPRLLPKPALTEWKLWKPNSNKFQVSLPAAPQVTSGKVVDPKTSKPHLHKTFLVPSENGRLYMIQVIRPDDQESSSDLKEIITSLASNSKDNLVKDLQEGVFKNDKSIDFLIENKDATIRGKAFKHGKEIYVLSMTTNDDESDLSDYTFFLNSFDFLEPDDKKPLGE
jgi:hypothetical protein